MVIFILFGKNGYRNRISNFLTNRKAPLVGCRLATALENRPRIKKEMMDSLSWGITGDTKWTEMWPRGEKEAKLTRD